MALRLLYRGKHLVHYGQVAIWDREDKHSYPVPSGPLPWRGPKGVCVPAKNDVEADIRVYAGRTDARLPAETPTLLVEAVIAVGRCGLEVGNVTTASTARIDWPAGTTKVAACYGGPSPFDTDAVGFVLASIP